MGHGHAMIFIIPPKCTMTQLLTIDQSARSLESTAIKQFYDLGILLDYL